MKKRMSSVMIIIVLLLTLAMFATACSNGDYKINFYDGDMVYDTVTTGGKEKITIPVDPTKSGYTFGGWYLEKEFTTQLKDDTYAKTKLKAEVNVYAKWTANDNTIIFNANGGTGEMSNLVIKTDATVSLSANTFVKAGYTFAGWATSQAGAKEFDNSASYKMGASGVTLFAKWTANDNTVTFYANDGTTSKTTQTIKTDATVNLTANTFVKAGYTFVGWATTASGAKEIDNGASYTMGASNIELFAVWTIDMTGMTFEETETSATLSLYNGTAANVVVPALYNGKPVVAIKANSFRYVSGMVANTTLESVIIPASVETIGDYAFFNLTKLKSITFESGSKLNSIGVRAFQGCGFETLTFPKTLTSIGNGAFYGCTALENVTFESESELNSLASLAFAACTALKEFPIPAKLTFVGNAVNYSAFLFAGIQNYIIDERNTTFRTEGGCLINGDTVIVAYDVANIVVPNGITKIGACAFSGLANVESIILPTSVTTIYQEAFASSSKLKSVIIPASVTTFGGQSFNGTSTTVYYEGATVPTTWAGNWKADRNAVITNCTLSADKSYVVSFTRTTTNIINAEGATIKEPYRAGYTFGGWYKDADCTQAVTEPSLIEVAPDTVVYPKWTAIV